MDKAKAAISDFVSKKGHHDTTVHETVAPAVQHETVKPHQHDQVNTAIDREVHQDHYHRSVQPIKDREVLPEQHTHNLGAVQHKEFDHRDHDSTKRALAADQSGFKDEQVVEKTTHSQSASPTVAGEHVHHHIHETVQPVIHKETIQPHVVHTTVPIHEVHHNKATHHDTTALPAMSMSDFKQKGGVLGGREERYDAFEGEPKNISGALSSTKQGAYKRDSAHADAHTRDNAPHGDSIPLDGRNQNNTTGVGGVGTDIAGTHNTNPVGGNIRKVEESGVPHHPGSGFNKTSSTSSKPSLMDKLNPRVDADGDGKKGFMS